MKIKTIALGAMLVTSSAFASISFETPSGSTDTDGSVNAKATFTLGNGSLTIVLENLQQGIKSSGQALSGILFADSDLSSGSFTTSFTGQTMTIGSGNNYTLGSSTTLNHWNGTFSGSSILVACNPKYPSGPGQIEQMIMGPPTYNFNNGAGNFNPYVYETATFILYNSAFTENGNISDVTFKFGTGSDTVKGEQSDNTPPSVPEPSTIVAGALILLPFGISTLRIMRKGRTA